MPSKFDFSGQTILVTGATRGIGAAIAEEFRLAGGDVVITGTKKDEIEKLEYAKRLPGKGSAKYLQADFSTDESLDRFLSEIQRFSKIDVCVNNAGVNRNNQVEEIEDSDYDRLMRINLEAPAKICRAVARTMKSAGAGRIVNIGSIWSIINKPGRGLYAATKAGLVGFTRNVAVDLAPYNVLVNTVSPGFTMTELTESMLSKEEIEQLSSEVPMRRFAQTREMANVVLFLSSEFNTYITGQNIVVDGGFTIV